MSAGASQVSRLCSMVIIDLLKNELSTECKPHLCILYALIYMCTIINYSTCPVSSDNSALLAVV